jgi:hypothetical protein
MGSSSKKVTVGFKYYMGLHLIFCHGPVDKVTKIEVEGKTAWTGLSTGGSITVSADNLFGGEDKEGGVSGVVEFEMGLPAQGRNSYLQSKLGTDIPAYRGVFGAILRQCYIGMSPYLRRWDIWASRIHLRAEGQAQWYDAKSEVNGDMNGAHIIRECLTDPEWGMGYPEADIDEDSFRAAADQMYAEGMGLSLLWDRGVSIEDFVGQVNKHIDASLYVHRNTGKFVLKLARGGYDVETLMELDESNVSKISDFKRGTLGELTNSVTVVYWDYETGRKGSVTVQDIALVAKQGATNGTTIQYPGFTRGALASQVASRDLKVMSTPLVSGVIYTNREAASLNIGDVFKLAWAKYGIVQVVMRVLSVELGNLDKNEVKITAIEDAFALGNSIYAAPPPSEWSDPITDPTACPHHIMFEAPFWEMVQRIGETTARAVDINSGFSLITATRPSSYSADARLYSNPGSGYKDYGSVDYCPTATLTSTVVPDQTSWVLSGVSDFELVAIGTYAVIGSEIVSVENWDSGTSTLTVGRGVLDTVPVPHTLGDRIFFVDEYCGSDNIEYALSEISKMKVLPVTSKGTLPIGSAPEQTVTIQARIGRPYPPGRLRINSLAYPTAISGTIDIPVDWRHRDRLQQTASLVNTEAGSIGPEAGTSYTVELRTSGGTLISSATGLTGTSHVFTLAAMGANYGTLRILVWSVRGGVDSLQKHDWAFTRNTP